MKQLIAILLALFLAHVVFAQSPPTINICSGDQTICVKASAQKICVKITVDAGLPTIDHFTIDWGDNTALTTVPGSNNPGTQEHTYDLSNFFKKCDAEDKFTIELLTYFVGEPNNPKNNSFVLRFHQPPLPDFSISGKSCPEDPITFGDKSCLNANTATYLWDFGNGQTSTLPSPTTTFSTPGVYIVKQCVKNNCGEECITKSLLILGLPDVKTLTATATPASGCFPLEVKMTATVQQVFDYDWSVVPLTPCTSCWQFVAVNGKDSIAPVIRFTKEGIYRVLLTGKNDCGQDTLSILVQAFAPPSVTFTGNPIGCKTYTYTPQITVANANPNSITTYKWTFPKSSPPMMSALPNPAGIQYVNPGTGLLTDTVTLTVTGPCGTQTIKQVVRVYGDTEVKFQPISLVCTGQQPFVIPVTPAPPIGTFSIVPTTPALNLTSGLFTPSQAAPGDYTVTYTVNIVGAPPGCQSSGTATFTVKNSAPVTLDAPAQLCLDAPLLALATTPASGGVFQKGKGLLSLTGNQYSAAKAGIGTDTLIFSYQDMATTCTSTTSRVIEIIGIPFAKAPDTLLTCDIPQEVDVQMLGNFTFSPNPPGATKTWSGPGVDPITGKFKSPGVGTYTLSVTYAVPPGCDTTVSFVVKSAPFTVASAGAATTVCKSQMTYALTGQPSGGKWSGPSVNMMTGVIDLSSLAPGTYEYTYTIAALTPCESSAKVSITVVGDGVVLGKTFDYVCQTAASYTLPTPIPATGTWSGDGWSGGNMVTVTGLSVGPHIYTYTEPTLPEACNTIQFTLYVMEQPTAAFALAPDTVCIGKTVMLSPVATDSVSYSVDWGDNSPIGPTLTHSYASEGDFDIALTVFTKHPLDGTVLCSNVLSKKIHVVAPPKKLAFLMNPKKGCGPLTVTFANDSEVESGQFRWQFGNFQTFIGEQPNTPIVFPPGTEDTTYIVRLTVTTGCDSLVFQDTVTVRPMPRADFGITYEQPCSGGLLQLNNTSVGKPFDSKWLIDGLMYTTLNPPDQRFFTDSLPRFVLVRLIASNPCGVDTAERTVTVNPTDVTALINISDTTRICVGDTATLTSFSTPGAPIRWKTASGNTFLDQQIQLTFAQPGLYQVTLYAEGCGFDSMNVWVRVQPQPTLTVQHPLLICPGDAASFEVKTDAPGSLLFYGDGDSTKLKISQHLYAAPNTYNLSATATSLAGCRKNWMGQINVATPPVAAAEMPDSVCSGSPIVLKSLNVSNLTCVWQFGDGNFGDGCTLSHTYAQAGLYSALLIVKDALGCRDTALVPVYVRATPSAAVQVEVLKKCSPALVRLSAQLQNATSILWDLGDGSTATTQVVEHIYQKGGTYAVQLTASNEGICSSTGTGLVTVSQTPLFDFVLKENCRIAQGTDLSILTLPANRPTVTGTGYSMKDTFHPGLPKSFYNVLIDSPDGCQNDTTIYITDPAELTLYVEEDSFDLQLGQTAQLAAVVNQISPALLWLPARWLSSDTILRPVAEPDRTVTYVITATDAKGCTVTDTVFIAVRIERDSGLYIPNIFTPNDPGAGGPDGVNDLFYIRSSNPSVDHLEEFRVIDKYGEIVHYVARCPAEQSAYGWDGTFRGQKAEQGVYRYQLLVVYKDGVTVPKSGSLLLAR